MKAKPFLLNRETTALVVVDMQNDFVRPSAPLEVVNSRKTIRSIAKLVGYARELKLPVIFTKFIAGPKHTLVWHWSPEIEKDRCCWKGHHRLYSDSQEPLECSDIIAELYPEKGDYIIEIWVFRFL